MGPVSGVQRPEPLHVYRSEPEHRTGLPTRELQGAIILGKLKVDMNTGGLRGTRRYAAATAILATALLTGCAASGDATPAAKLPLGPPELAATIDLDSQPAGVAVDPANESVYVVHRSGHTVSVIDTDTHEVKATIDVGVNLDDIAIDPSTHTAYVTHFDIGDQDHHGMVSVIDTDTREIIDTIEVDRNATAVAVDAADHKLYVVHGFIPRVSVIDTETNTVTSTLDAGQGGALDVAVDPTTHTAYVTVRSTVAVFESGQLTPSTVIDVGQYSRLAIDPAAHRLYATTLEGSLVVIDTETRTKTATVKVGRNPIDVAVDPGLGSVYVLNNGDKSVSIIDSESWTLTHTIPVGANPQEIVIDPGTHTTYVSNLGDDTVSAITR